MAHIWDGEPGRSREPVMGGVLSRCAVVVMTTELPPAIPLSAPHATAMIDSLLSASTTRHRGAQIIRTRFSRNHAIVSCRFCSPSSTVSEEQQAIPVGVSGLPPEEGNLAIPIDPRLFLHSDKNRSNVIFSKILPVHARGASRPVRRTNAGKHPTTNAT